MESDGSSPKWQASRSMLGVLLVERGILNAEDLAGALQVQKATGDYLGNILLKQKLVTEAQLMEVLAEQLSLEYLPLADAMIEPDAVSKVSSAIATRYQLMPVKLEGNKLTVATADPLHVQVLDELKLLLKCDVIPILSGLSEIKEAIQRHYGIGASAVERLLDSDTVSQKGEVQSTAEDLTSGAEDASVISFVNQMLLTAARDRATDIHVEPFDQILRIRQRIDGVMYEMPIPPEVVRLHSAIVSRVKVMAKLDIAERRLPQDGRIKVRMEGQDLDLRVSILPTSYGETINIRLLSSNRLFNPEDLGLEGGDLTTLERLIHRPHGILFVTGPTGSGKSTTLYTCLSQLNKTSHKILTIEDPIEYQIQGVTQLQVHPRIGFTFANGLRSMLRHDPDIMMVGEVRDPETAEITIRSALTGHLVFSTLHTNDAAGGVTRLLDMGIEPFLVASSVMCFVGQRLVRVVCPACKEARRPELDLKEEFQVEGPVPDIYYGKGCKACKETGFKGRTAIYEFLLVTDEVKDLILKRSSSQEIAAQAVAQGMRTMRQDGWMKVIHGITTPEEVIRVT